MENFHAQMVWITDPFLPVFECGRWSSGAPVLALADLDIDNASWEDFYRKCIPFYISGIQLTISCNGEGLLSMPLLSAIVSGKRRIVDFNTRILVFHVNFGGNVEATHKNI